MRIPTHRPPTHPGEMLLEEFLKPMGISQRELAAALHLPYPGIRELTKGRRRLTSGMALRLAKYLGTSADFWMNLQLRWDLYHAQQEEAAELKAIRPRARSAG